MQNNIISGLFVGQNFVELKEVDSTNTYLKKLLSNTTPLSEGTVIMAENQYAGRGQMNNTWLAESGKNLTFSLLLYPRFLAIEDQFDLTRAVSLGVFDALHPLLGQALKIKWPNDIYYHDNKLGGMLIENMIQKRQIKNAVIGIGINVNQESFPKSVHRATSLKQILHRDYDLKALLSEICAGIEAWYLQLKAARIKDIREAYHSRLYGLNEERNFRAGEMIFKGAVTGVKAGGLLLVTDNKGRELEFSLKEIEFLID